MGAELRAGDSLRPSDPAAGPGSGTGQPPALQCRVALSEPSPSSLLYSGRANLQRKLGEHKGVGPQRRRQRHSSTVAAPGRPHRAVPPYAELRVGWRGSACACPPAPPLRPSASRWRWQGGGAGASHSRWGGASEALTSDWLGSVLLPFLVPSRSWGRTQALHSGQAGGRAQRGGVGGWSGGQSWLF